MAIPTISSTPYPSAFVDAKADTVSPTVDYETGGIGLQDPSAGLMYQTWTCKTDGTDITIEADNTAPIVVYTGINITEVSLAFDANMQYFVAFIEDGQAKFKWFDSTIGDFTVTSLNALDANPRCTLDDKRELNNSGRSIQLFYLRNDRLYARYQNDRYENEEDLGAITVGKKLAKIGMMDSLRIGYVLSDTLTIETPSGAFIPPWNKLAISFFVRPSLSSGDANAIAIGQSKIAAVNYNKDSGLYLKLPNNQELRLYEEGFPEDYTYLVAVNLSKVLNKTKVELLAKRLDDCLDTEKITGEYTSTELGGSHVITQIRSDPKIYIGDPRASTPDVSLIFDKLRIREKWYTTTEIDGLASAGGYCQTIGSGEFEATASGSGLIFIAQKSGGVQSVSTAELFVTVLGGSGNYKVTYDHNPASTFFQVTDNPSIKNPGDGLVAVPYEVIDPNFEDNEDGSKTARLWAAGYSPASGYDIDPGGTAYRQMKTDWVAEDLTTGETISGTISTAVTIQDFNAPIE